MKSSAPLKFIAAVVVVYILLKVPALIVGAPLPSSVVGVYMVLSVVVILLVMTSTDEGCEALFRPIVDILYGRAGRGLRYPLLLVLPLIFAYVTYGHMGLTDVSQVSKRVVHPPAPSVITVYGRTIELRDLKNPFRGKDGEDGEVFKEAVADGGRVYFERCFFCHGAKLDGKGHLAKGMIPKPLPFTGTDTIAQLEESYVFWRIAKGAEGLPPESAPEMSVMPAWETLLTEDELWKVTAFIYDYTGNVPRTWSESLPTKASFVDKDKGGKDIYKRLCAWCHGTDGRGDGVSAERLLPPPRDLTDGIYKFTSTPYDEFFPSTRDIFDTIKFGLNDTSMPAWGDVLGGSEIDSVVEHLKELSSYETPKVGSISYEPKVPSSKESVEQGRVIFRRQCTECHGISGGGDTRKRLKDDWGATTWPRNFTKSWSFKSSNSPRDIYARVTAGIPATQMPSYGDENNKDRLSAKDRWHVANYVASLASPYKEPRGEDTIRAGKVDGKLPRAVNNSLWETAERVSLYLYPKVLFNDDGSDGLLKPTLDSLVVRVLYNDEEFAVLTQWDDFTKSIKGDRKAELVAGGSVAADSLNVEFISLKERLRWSSEHVKSDADGKGFWSWGEYSEGTWRVIVKAPLDYLEDDSTPLEFLLLDGSNLDGGLDGDGYVTTGRKRIVLKSGAGAGVIVWPVAIFIFVLAVEFLWIGDRRRG